MYKIGFYNPLIESNELENECNIVFSDIDKLKAHLRDDDIIISNSDFSFYGLEKEMISLSDKYIIYIRGGNLDTSSEFERFRFKTIMGINEYIRNNKETIEKLYKEYEEGSN